MTADKIRPKIKLNHVLQKPDEETIYNDNHFYILNNESEILFL